MNAALRPVAAAAAALLSAMPLSVAAQVQTFVVDCSLGQTISKALEMGDSRKPLVLQVRGTCTENVWISRDDVTLQGPATINATSPSTRPIVVTGMRVTIDRLTLNGGVNGIYLGNAMGTTISNCLIQGAAYGVFSINASGAVLTSTIQNNGLAGAYLRGGRVRFVESVVQTNPGGGIMAGAHANILAENNDIRNNGAQGVLLANGSKATLNGDRITSNAGNGIELGQGSQASLLNVNVSNNAGHGISVNFSQLSVEGGSITAPTASTNGVVLGASTAEFNNLTIASGHNGVVMNSGSIAVITGGAISAANRGLTVTLNGTAKINAPASISTASSSVPAIRLQYGSKAWFDSDGTGTYPNVNGALALSCSDKESSYTGIFNTSGVINCTDYNN